ncbi:MAG: hypothetical protein LHV68_10480 [Elusimicrobia bacterium]|nr:hypothetical protein [Candidatus Liberimonas magnetica]
MKINLIVLIILCLFINLFSSFAVNAQESGIVATAALGNTIDVARTFLALSCVSATVDIVMGKITFQSSIAIPEKNKSQDKSKTAKDFEQVFSIPTFSNYSWNISECKACQDFNNTFAVCGNDLQFLVLLKKFLLQFFIFLIFMTLFFLLPRGTIDNYVISNINIKTFKPGLS